VDVSKEKLPDNSLSAAHLKKQMGKSVFQTFGKAEGSVKGKVLDLRGWVQGTTGEHVTVTIGWEDGHVDHVRWKELGQLLVLPLESDGPAAEAASDAAVHAADSARAASSAVSAAIETVTAAAMEKNLVVDRDALVQFFHTHTPDKVESVDVVMEHYTGNANGLRDALQEKFGASAAEAADVVKLTAPLDLFVTFSDGDAADQDGDDADESKEDVAAASTAAPPPPPPTAAVVANEAEAAANKEAKPFAEPFDTFLERRKERRNQRRRRWEGDPYAAIQRKADFGADNVRQVQGPVLIVRGWTSGMEGRMLRDCYKELQGELRRYAHKYEVVMWDGDLHQRDSYTSLMSRLLTEKEFEHLKFVAFTQEQWMGELVKGCRTGSKTRSLQQGQGFDVNPEEVIMAHEEDVYRDYSAGLSTHDDTGQAVPLAVSKEVNGNRHFLPIQRLTVIGFDASGQVIQNNHDGCDPESTSDNPRAVLSSAGLKFAKDVMGFAYASFMTIGEDRMVTTQAKRLKSRDARYPRCKLIRLQAKREVRGKIERSPPVEVPA
jgi:hypothetical protein